MVKVLYIEDDPDDAIIVRRYLGQSKNQFTVEVAVSGADAKEKLLSDSFDCVLLDQNLPDTNGLAILQDIKSKWPKVPVLMLTGQKDDRLSIGSSKLGADEFILKDEMNTAVLTETIFSVIHLGEEIEDETSQNTHYKTEPSISRYSKEGATGIYETLVNTMTEGMLSLDLNQTILFVNQQAGDMLKGSADSFLGLRAASLFDKSGFELFLEKFNKTIEGAQEKYESELICQDGQLLPVIISQSPYYDRRNNLAGCLMVVTDISERKKAENELALSEKRFRDIAENTTDLIWEMDLDGRFVYVNPMVKHILGFEPDELIGKRIDKFAVSSEKKNRLKFIKSEFSRRVPVRFVEEKWCHKRGHEIFLEMSSIPIYNMYGEIVGYRGINRDITQRKQNEEKQIRETEADLQIERCISSVAKKLYEIEDFEKAIMASVETIGKTFGAAHCCLYLLADGENGHYLPTYCYRDHAQFKKERYAIEVDRFPSWHNCLSDNKYIKINDASHAMKLDNPERQFLLDSNIASILIVPLFIRDSFYGYIGIDYVKEHHVWRMTEIAAVRSIAENISKVIERKQAQATFLHQKAKYESVVKNTGDGVVLLDNDYKITLINPAARKMLFSFWKNIRTGSVMKKIGEICIENVVRTMEKQNVNSISKELKSVNGRARFFTFVFSSVKNTNNEVAGLVLNIHEITEIRRAHEQLLQSSKLASLGQLAAGVAHELNNPLTYMLGYTELLLSTRSDAETKSKLTKILDGGRRVKNIIDNMLEFSRNQTTNMELADVTNIIENTLSLMGRRLSTHDIRLIKTIDKKLSLIYCNKGELQQVFLNLIKNAFDEMIRSKTGDKIEIVTEQLSAQRIRLKFIDNGPGMAEQVRQRIFDPFYTTKAPGQGTGLGLSISYKIIQKHEGTISVKSELGRGSTFIIELPTKLNEMDNSYDEIYESPELEKEHSTGDRGNILIFEDSKKCERLTKILYRTCHRVVTCNDVHQALEMFCNDNVDLLFLDIKQLKKIKYHILNGKIRNWKTRILFLFDYPMNESVKKSLLSRGVGCIAKPFKVDEVIRLVNIALAKIKSNS